MSIQDEIRYWVLEGELKLFTQLMPRLADRRQIYLTPDIKRAIDGDQRNRRVDRRFGRARALLEVFLRGDRIVARLPPSKNVDVLVALLCPERENVWEFRIREPRPGLRIFGRFAAKDVFIGTHCYRREELPESDDWPYEIGLCQTAWKNLFPAYRPLRGNSLNEFISNARLP